MTDSLAGRTALVTGGGSGLGAAIARALAANGCGVILLARNADRLAATAATIAGRVRTVVADVREPASVARVADELSDEDISILINNAGVPGPVANLVDIGPSDWDETFAVNVRGIFLMCRAFLPPMIARGRGDVINISSVSGKRPLPGRTPYAASKMAVIGLTTTLAHEVAPYGVRVNSLSPGPVTGPRMARNFRLEAARRGISEPEAEAEFVNRSALRRMVTEDEVGTATVAMLHMQALCAADVDLSAGMVAR